MSSNMLWGDYFYLGYSGRSYSSDRYSFCRKKKPLAISEINVKLPPFKSGEHNPASASTIDHVPFTVEYLTFIQI